MGEYDCPMIGVGGRHSPLYFDDGACTWCGAMGPTQQESETEMFDIWGRCVRQHNNPTAHPDWVKLPYRGPYATRRDAENACAEMRQDVAWVGYEFDVRPASTGESSKRFVWAEDEDVVPGTHKEEPHGQV